MGFRNKIALQTDFSELHHKIQEILNTLSVVHGALSKDVIDIDSGPQAAIDVLLSR